MLAAASNSTYTQTRCVLRYLYADDYTGASGLASCSDVIIYSRDSDVGLTISVSLPSGSTAISSQAALTRLLNSSWAGLSTTSVHSFTPNASAADDLTSNQIRLADNAIVIGSTSYTINLVLSATATMAASELAASLREQDLTTIFGVNVTGSSLAATTGSETVTTLTGAAEGAANTITASTLLTLCAMGAAWIMQRAASP